MGLGYSYNMKLKPITPQDLISWIEGLEPGRIINFQDCGRCVFASFYREFHGQLTNTILIHTIFGNEDEDKIRITGWLLDFQDEFRSLANRQPYDGYGEPITTAHLLACLPMLRALIPPNPTTLAVQQDTTSSIVVDVPCDQQTPLMV